MTQHKFSGVIPILATPFNDDESLDLASWQRMIDFMVELGVDGITILGVLGESNRLSDHEREALIKSAVAIVKQRIPVATSGRMTLLLTVPTRSVGGMVQWSRALGSKQFLTAGTQIVNTASKPPSS